MLIWGLFTGGPRRKEWKGGAPEGACADRRRTEKIEMFKKKTAALEIGPHNENDEFEKENAYTLLKTETRSETMHKYENEPNIP
jgi:hypothetical protein